MNNGMFLLRNVPLTSFQWSVLYGHKHTHTFTLTQTHNSKFKFYSLQLLTVWFQFWHPTHCPRNFTKCNMFVYFCVCVGARVCVSIVFALHSSPISGINVGILDHQIIFFLSTQWELTWLFHVVITAITVIWNLILGHHEASFIKFSPSAHQNFVYNKICIVWKWYL